MINTAKMMIKRNHHKKMLTYKYSSNVVGKTVARTAYVKTGISGMWVGDAPLYI